MTTRSLPRRRPGLGLLLAFTGLVLAAAAPAARAETPSERMEQRVDNRQARQDQRIDQGVKSGHLTAREARRLEHQQARIERLENRALANDGRIGPREAARLEHRQDKASRHIYRQKRDPQSRSPG